MLSGMSDCSCETCGYELEIGDVKCGGCGAECDPDATRGFKIERKITRGNTLVLELRAQNPFTKAYPDADSAGFKARVTVRQNLGDTYPAFVGSYDLGDIVDQGGGRWLATIPSDVTYAFPDGVVKLYYDVQFVEGGKTWTQEKGLIRVMPGVAAYFDPQNVARKTRRSEHDRKVVEVSTSGLSDVELFAYAGALSDGQGLKLELSVLALRDGGGEADSWSGIVVYRKSGGVLALVNEKWEHDGATSWAIAADPGVPRVLVHSAAAVNAAWTARVETTLLKSA